MAAPNGRRPERAIPSDLDAEKALLGAAMLTADAAHTVAELGPSAFFDPRHQHIANAIGASLVAHHVAIADPVLVAGFLGDAGLLDSIGGKEALFDLQAGVGAISNHARYAERIRHTHAQRQLANIGIRLSEAAYADDTATSTRIVAELVDADQPTTAIGDRLRANLFTAEQVLNLPPPDPTVDGLLFTPGVALVYGPPKGGKTFWSLHLGLSIATGLSFDGRVVHQCPVLYVSAEGRGGLGGRLDAWARHHDRLLPDDFYVLTAAPNLMTPGDVTMLAGLARELDVGCIILDTLARCSVGADENSARDMGQVIAALDVLRDATGLVIAVHHTGKDSKAGYRGSSALGGAVDTAIEITGGDRLVHVEVRFQKDLAPAEASWWRMESVARSLVLTSTSPAAATDEATKSTWQVLDALRSIYVPGGIGAKDWQEACGDTARTSFFRARKWLIDHGLVTKEGRGYAPVNQEES